MVEIPEHLLQRSREAMARAKAKKGEAQPESGPEPAEAKAEATPPQHSEDEAGTVATPQKPATEAAPAPAPAPAPAAAPAPAPAATATAVATRPTPSKPKTASEAKPAQKTHTHRLLTVVKSGSIQQTKPEAVDKVNVWPHLLAIEFLAALACLVFLVVFSIFVNAPLLAEANYNLTPNPSKAPWYFLGLQELLAYFDPMVAGVTIPGMGIFWLMVTPYIDKNPSTDPNHRKFAIALFTYFLMFWAVLVIIGSFFRGPGYNFVFPWTQGLFFEL
ncbi:MAG: menaquinol-cytochrome c reductase cytochrome b subunit [Acidimicrobiia bacterium]